MLKRRSSCFKIHAMFLLTVICRAFFCGASYMYYSALTNEAVASSSVVFFHKASCYITGITLFVTILLVGSGWSFIRWMIHRRMRFIVVLLIALQSGYWMFYLKLESMARSDPAHEDTRRASHLLDIASCCVILFPIVWSIQQLKTEARTEAAAAASAERDDAEAVASEAPAIKEKLLQLRGFYSQVTAAFLFLFRCCSVIIPYFMCISNSTSNFFALLFTRFSRSSSFFTAPGSFSISSAWLSIAKILTSPLP